MKMHFQSYGKEPFRLVILHGLMGSGQNWRSIAKKLAPDYSSLVPTFRNHGNSPHGHHDLESMKNDLTEMLDSQDLGKIDLIGHSMGGMVAMYFALLYPERVNSLLVVDIAPLAKLSNMEHIFQPLLNLNLGELNSQNQAEEELKDLLPDNTVRQFLLQNLKRAPGGSYQWKCNLHELHEFTKHQDRFILPEGLKYQGKTTFIGGGKSDHKIQEKEASIRDYFPKAQIQMIKQAGHWVHFEAPDLFLHLVNNFLAR